MRNGFPPFEILGDTTFNSLIQSLLALAKKHYQTINFEDMERYKPSLPEFKVVETVSQRPDRSERYIFPAEYLARYSTRQVTRSPTPTPPPPSRPVFDSHKALGVLLTKCLKQPWLGRAQVPDQFKRSTTETSNGDDSLDTSRCSCRKRRASNMSEDESHPYPKRRRETSSGTHTSISCPQGWNPVRDDESGSESESESQEDN